MFNKNDEIISLLKRGRNEAARQFVDEQKKKNYPENFTVFMNQMLDEYRIKKKEVAIRSGLSQDYTYKLLNGAKKTRERDYILAICIAIGMNISQTQHALNIYGMPMLNKADIRSNVIYNGISYHKNIDEINAWLEYTGLVYIKTNPDMPSANIELRMQNDTASVVSVEKIHHVYEEVERQIEAEPCGNAPMDYCYWGIITVKDESGKKYYVEATYAMDGDNLIVLDEENYKKSIAIMHNDSYFETDYEENYLEAEILEQYDSLLEASHSEFFKFFLELDHATDKKVEEIMEYIDDTRNYGTRIGAGIMEGQKVCYLEAFNNNNPAEREYLQIVQRDGELTYSASHESYFMRYELGELYSLYFSDKRKPEYYLNIKDTKELSGKNIRIKFILDDLRLKMHQYVKDTYGGLFDADDNELTHDLVNCLVQRATWLIHGHDLQEALNLLMQAVSIMKEAESKGDDYSVPLVVTYSKIATIYGNMGAVEEMFDTYETLYQMKDRASVITKSNSEGIESALWSLAEGMLHTAQRCQNVKGQYDVQAKEIVKEAIDLLEDRCTHEGSYATLFMAYTKYAYMIDVDEPDRAAKYCRKAVTIVNAYHLDQNSNHQDLVITLYNNYAWVLWNKLESEEAIIYYGRAIELLESFLFIGSRDREHVIDNLKHVGKALYELYDATNKNKEACMLRERLAENGVEI